MNAGVPDFSKKVKEITYFLKNSKVWDYIKKTKRYEKKLRLSYCRKILFSYFIAVTINR